MRKRLSDVKFIMTTIEKVAREKGLLKEIPRVSNINKILEECSEGWSLETSTPQNRKRRHGQLQWQTVCKYLRQKKMKTNT